jgi:hypothetical protein
MNAPEHLQHKPIIVVNDYHNIDGQYAPTTDAKALSMGFDQWGDGGISAKVFRHTGNRWSRQSEELPPHRVIDLCNLIVASIMYSNSESLPSSNLDIKINNQIDVEKIKEYFDENQETLIPKIMDLKRMIDSFLESRGL